MAKWNPGKVAKRFLEKYEDDHALEELQKKLDKLLKDRSKDKAKITKPTDMEIRSLMFATRNGAEKAPEQIVELIDTVHAVSMMSLED